MQTPDISLEVVSTVTELIASCENNIKILSGIAESEDATFDLACIRNRLDSLIPILESTEKVIRTEYVPSLKSKQENVSLSIQKMLPSLEETSLKLWNILNFKQKESEELIEGQSTPKPWKIEFKKMMRLKYFVSMLLSLFSLLDISNGGSKIRSLKCLLRSYYECIDMSDLEIGKDIKEYVEKLCIFMENYELRNDEQIIYKTLKLEFLILDMQSSLLSNNISMAKFYENKANILENCSTMKSENVFNICRTLYNDGLKLYKEKSYYDSHYFLKKCYLILEKMEAKSGPGAENKIRVSALIMLAKCCMKINNEESYEEASKLLKLLRMNEHEKVESLKLQIELIDFQKLESKEAEDLIMKTIITFSADTTVLNQVMLVLNAYSHRNPTIAKNCMLYIFTNKMSFEDEQFKEIIESYLISIIWLITSQLKSESSSEKLCMAQNILEIGDKKLVFELSLDSTNCLLIMLWSLGKKKMKEQNFEEAMEWFECCFVRILNKSCEGQQGTTGKIQRSMLQCCLKLQNADTFKKVLANMKDSDRENPITLYYHFAWLLQSHDKNSVSQVHQILTKLSQFNESRTINLLALCVIESKSYLDSGGDGTDKKYLEEPLKQAIDKLLNKCYVIENQSSDSLLLVALRSSVYIYGKSLENDLKTSEHQQCLLEDVEMIEKSVGQFLRYVKENVEKTDLTEITNDLEWFSSNCFNYGLTLLERNILDIKGVKLFQLVISLVDTYNDINKEVKNAFFKWKCKAIVFLSFCEREIMNRDKTALDKKWIDIRKMNQAVVDQITALHKEKEYKDVLFQSILIIDECLIVCREWSLLTKKIQDMNEYGKRQKEDNEEIDFIVEKIFDSGICNEANSNEVITIIDVLFVERGYKKEHGVGVRMLFKWLHLLLTKLTDQIALEEKQITYVRMFKQLLIEAQQKDTEKLKDYEIEWLAGVCWNKGIEIVLRNKNDVTNADTADDNDEDISMEDSLLVEERETRADVVGAPPPAAASDVPCRQGLPWCEEAIAISGISSAKVQLTGMQRLFGRLVKESAVSGGFSLSGNCTHREV